MEVGLRRGWRRGWRRLRTRWQMRRMGRPWQWWRWWWRRWRWWRHAGSSSTPSFSRGSATVGRYNACSVASSGAVSTNSVALGCSSARPPPPSLSAVSHQPPPADAVASSFNQVQRAIWRKPGQVEVDASAANKIKSALSANHEEVLDLFRQWDENGDGKLEKEELRKVIAMLGIEAPAHNAELVFDSFDEDGNGFVQIHELWHAIRNPVQQHVARLESARQPSSQVRPGSSSSPDG